MKEKELTLEELIELVDLMDESIIQTNGANESKP